MTRNKSWLDLGPRRRKAWEIDSIRTMLRAETDEVERNTCLVCGKTIRVQIFRDTNYCSGLCQSFPHTKYTGPCDEVPF